MPRARVHCTVTNTAPLQKPRYFHTLAERCGVSPGLTSRVRCCDGWREACAGAALPSESLRVHQLRPYTLSGPVRLVLCFKKRASSGRCAALSTAAVHCFIRLVCRKCEEVVGPWLAVTTTFPSGSMWQLQLCTPSKLSNVSGRWMGGHSSS